MVKVSEPRWEETSADVKHPRPSFKQLGRTGTGLSHLHHDGMVIPVARKILNHHHVGLPGDQLDVGPLRLLPTESRLLSNGLAVIGWFSPRGRCL